MPRRVTRPPQAAARPVDERHSLVLERKDFTRLRSGGNNQLYGLVVESSHLDRYSQCGLRERHWNLGDQIKPFTPKLRIWLDFDKRILSPYRFAPKGSL